MRLIKTSLAAILICVLTMSCGDSSYEESGDNSTAPAKPSAGETDKKTGAFAAVDSVLKKSCLSCHSGGTAPNLQGYDNASKRAEIILAEVESGRMPPSKKLSQSDIDVIADWVEDDTPR